MASNIRDLKFTYFGDITGTTTLAITDPGGGAYDPGTPATLNAAARSKRAEIKAIRLSLVGLNQSGDTGWTQVGEPIASVRNRRQYTLESMIVPRNLGKRGMWRGQLMKVYILAYCVYRFLTEMIRPEAKLWAALTGYQWGALVLALLFVWLLWRERPASEKSEARMTNDEVGGAKKIPAES